MTEIIKTYAGADVIQSLGALEVFIGDMDGKYIGTATDDNTFIDEGTVDVAEAVTELNGVILALERRDAEIERLRAQCDGLAQSAANNGQALILYERALERIAALVDSEDGEPLDEAIDIANKALAFKAPELALGRPVIHQQKAGAK